MPNYHYAYLVGTGIFWVAWIVCFVLGKQYRSHIGWGTLIAAPMALTSILFVPQYWTPDSLFNLDRKIRVGIEDFLWAAAVGGIASVIGEVLIENKLAALRKLRPQIWFLCSCCIYLSAGLRYVYVGIDAHRASRRSAA